MAVSLPISAAFNPPATTPARTGSGAPVMTATPASIRVPLAFMVTGLLALLAGVIWLVAQPFVLTTYHYNQYVIAMTHLFVLGWMASIVMGAMYQLVPVALETHLHSVRLAKWHLALHVIGFTGMVWMFWRWDLKQVGHFGSAFAVGVGLFVYNLARTLWRVPRWSVTATAVSAALVWISLTVLAGLAIAAGKCSYESTTGLATAGGVQELVSLLRNVASGMARFDQISAMHAHAHLGAVGFFILLIVGVSYKLVPMFTLSEVQSRRRAAWSLALLNAGLLGTFFTILLRHPGKLVFTGVILAALTLYGIELRAILRARKRATLDWGLRYFLTAVGLLVPLAALAVVLSWPGLPLNALTGQLENLYGFLGLIGVVTFAILGMLYKIIPFLAWFGSYSRQVGRARVPALADMYSARLQMAGYWLFLAGLLVTSAGIGLASQALARAGSGLLAASIAVFVVNVGMILSHLVRPRLAPLGVAAAPQTTPP